MSESFKSRIAVTAAGSGIGAVTARGLAREGACVVVADLSGKPAEETAAGTAAAGGEAAWIKRDAAEPGAVQAAVRPRSCAIRSRPWVYGRAFDQRRS